MYECVLALVVGAIIAMIVQFSIMIAKLEVDIETNGKLIEEFTDRIARVKHDLNRLEHQLDLLIEQAEGK